MGVNEAFQLFVGACLSGITIIYFLVFYMGKREHKARWIIIYMTIQILSNWIIKMYRGYGHDERIMIVIYIVGFLYMFVGISRWSDKKRLLTLILCFRFSERYMIICTRDTILLEM